MLVPEVNWGLFNELPGAADENFEKLCRALVRRHYGSSGRFNNSQTSLAWSFTLS